VITGRNAREDKIRDLVRLGCKEITSDRTALQIGRALESRPASVSLKRRPRGGGKTPAKGNKNYPRGRAEPSGSIGRRRDKSGWSQKKKGEEGDRPDKKTHS